MRMERALGRAAAAALVVTVTAGCTINLGSPTPDPPEDTRPTASGTPNKATATPPPPARTATPDATPTSSAPASSSSGWASLTEEVRSGVLRLQVAGCDSGWSGTGFLLPDRYVVTAAHVAQDAASISVKSDRGIVRAEVVESELSSDTALLRLNQDLGGHEFQVAEEVPGLGSDIGVLGYPFGVYNLRLTKGTISGEEQPVTYDGPEGFTVDQVVTTDAATNGGNSGGPAIDASGQVVGLVSGGKNWSGDPTQPVPAQGTNYLVPAEVIKERVKSWRGSEPQAETCGEDGPAPVDDDFDLDVAIGAANAAADDIALSLYVHGDSINQGLYEAAWSLFTEKLQAKFRDDVDRWSAGLASSYWDRLEVEEVTRDGDRAEADVALRTRQDPEDSADGRQDCSDWSMTYTMRLSRGVWFLEEADAGGGPEAC